MCTSSIATLAGKVRTESYPQTFIDNDICGYVVFCTLLGLTFQGLLFLGECSVWHIKILRRMSWSVVVRGTSQRVGKHMLTAYTGHEHPSVLFIASPGGNTTIHYHLLHRNRDATIYIRLQDFHIMYILWAWFCHIPLNSSPPGRMYPLLPFPSLRKCFKLTHWRNHANCLQFICHSLSQFGGMAKAKRLGGGVELDAMEPTESTFVGLPL